MQDILKVLDNKTIRLNKPSRSSGGLKSVLYTEKVNNDLVYASGVANLLQYLRDANRPYLYITPHTFERYTKKKLIISSLHFTRQTEQVEKLVQLQGRHNSLSTTLKVPLSLVSDGLIDENDGPFPIILVLRGEYLYSGVKDIYTSLTKLGSRVVNVETLANAIPHNGYDDDGMYTSLRSLLRTLSAKLKNFIVEKNKEFDDAIYAKASELKVPVDNYKVSLLRFGGLYKLRNDMMTPEEKQLKMFANSLNLNFARDYIRLCDQLLPKIFNEIVTHEVERIDELSKDWEFLTFEDDGDTYDEIVLANYKIEGAVLMSSLFKSNENFSEVEEALVLNDIPVVSVAGSVENNFRKIEDAVVKFIKPPQEVKS